MEVIRQGLWLLNERTDREALRRAYAQAAEQVRPSTLEEVRELDGLAGEGLAEEV